MSQLEILYLNIAELSTNYVALRQIVEEKRPFLVLIAETHIVDIEAFEQYNIPGNVAACLSHSRHTGGVAIYAKESVQFKLQLNEALFLLIHLFDRLNRGKHNGAENQ